MGCARGDDVNGYSLSQEHGKADRAANDVPSGLRQNRVPKGLRVAFPGALQQETKLPLPQDRCAACDYADLTSPRRFRGGHVRGPLSMSVGPMVHNELQSRVAVELIYLQSVNRMYYLG
jgi:hypothetical protein